VRILELLCKSDNKAVIKTLAGEPEFRHLRGFTDHICMFATQTIDQPSKITKTGARHSFAKWLLLPVKLRNKFESSEYDYGRIKAGYVEFQNSVYFIFRVDKKGLESVPGKKPED